MTVNLCESFRALAFRTFDQMGKGRRVGHQPLEETFTDTNILELKDRHASEIYSRTFNKHEEGINGADWEWWLTNSSRSLWLGLRVQAKVLHFESNNFVHLHYRSGKTKAYQLGKLKRQSAKDGLVPLYCFYVHEPTFARTHGRRCGSFAHTVESYGCSIAPLSHVESLQKKGEVKDLSSVMAGALPWHCLVCCSGYGGKDLPSRAWSLLKSEFGFKEPREQLRAKKNALKPTVGPRMHPPHYVEAALEGYEPDMPPVGVRGVLIIVGRDDC
ncbi:MAG: hypothetical protein Q8K74_02265 [Candidatus Nitrotoga sp.]|nr:hypothetical protein [Candidatus Nitrotoga sp.]MDP1854859.1 hypothetical protein [Candidatus Nitrotoga sp.]